jgi:hypothetical protein
MNPPLETTLHTLRARGWGTRKTKSRSLALESGARDDNNVGINKKAGLRGRLYVSTIELTLNETCQNPDGTRELLAP